MPVAVIIDRGTFDIIHHQEGQPFGRAAAIEQLDYIGMVQVCESLPFLAESTQQFMAIESRLDQLDGHLFLILIVSAYRKENRSHAAMRNPPYHSVGSEPTTGHRLYYLRAGSGRGKCGARFGIKSFFRVVRSP